ncbi:hypothetical protein G830_04882 [Escherichia coli HVH 176 (4-3428664)]|nr:hypothetical protein G830_04882 [Escherichia coli HVH 176 (4-3428664)]
MYSYEDRLRAVRLYLKLGRRMSATLRQLGYPTKNSLKAWLAEFERNQDLRRGYQRIKRQGNDSNLLIVFYVQIMPDDFVMQLHRF